MNMKDYDLDDINVLFGIRLRQIRLEKGLTQEQLGYECGLHRTYVGQIERAEKNITLKNIEKIAKHLDINITELLDFSKIRIKR
ncbi:MAG: helix-turn-helix transcriptional regulator [Bacilli bacterium]|nr:helix-turn-helix transcriptional regulator [Bacilli bacterium]